MDTLSLLLVGALLSGVAAQPPPDMDLDDDDEEALLDREGAGGDGPGLGREERGDRRKRAKKEMDMARVLRIADAVSLNEAQALRVSEALRAGDEKRREVRKQLKVVVKELQAMSDGTPSQREVDAKVKQAQELRVQVMKVEEETLEGASKGLAPQQKAKMAIVLGIHDKKMRKMMFDEFRRRRGDMGPPQAPQPPPAPPPPGRY
jgi:hypothetical protein